MLSEDLRMLGTSYFVAVSRLRPIKFNTGMRIKVLDYLDTSETIFRFCFLGVNSQLRHGLGKMQVIFC